MRNGAYWVWCDIDGHGKRWHLAFTKRSDFGDDDEIVFPLDDFEDIAENYSDYPVQAVIAPMPLRPQRKKRPKPQTTAAIPVASHTDRKRPL